MRLGVAGLAVTTMWLGYALLSTLWLDGSARGVAPYIYAPLLILGGVWLGRALAQRVAPRLVALVVLVLAGWMLVGGLLAAEPIGYANANAALAVQLAALAGLASVNLVARPLALAAVALGLLTILANRSAGALIAVVPLTMAIVMALWRAPGRRRWPAVALAVLAMASVTTAFVALVRRTAWPQVALDAFDETRRSLWLLAWESFRRAETVGYGPGGYEALNPITDPDRTSAHSLPLQVAVELGGVGLILLAGMFLVGLAVAVRAATPAQAWITIAAWSALAVHAFVDHLVEYWPITLAAGLVLGYGLVSQADPEPQNEVV